MYDIVIISAFAFIAQMQLATFGKWYGGMHNTTICTGDLRNFAQIFYAVVVKRDNKDKSILRDILIMVTAFPIGSLVGVFICNPLQQKGAWVGCIIIIMLYFVTKQN